MLFTEALTYAARIHAGQTRNNAGMVPYIAHPLAVCSIVLESRGSEIEAIAALLHDGPEDCGGKRVLDEIRSLFGNEVARIVEGCSDSLVDTAVEDRPPWRERKERYLVHLAAADPSTLLVSLADKLHNLRTTTNELLAIESPACTNDEPFSFRRSILERFAGKADGLLWYYSRLNEIFVNGAGDIRRDETRLQYERELTRFRAAIIPPGPVSTRSTT